MIVTCTPNPSLDRTVEIPRLRPGAVHRASGTHLDAGGKGVNVARALALHGSPTLAVLPVGGMEGQHLAALLAGLHLDHAPVRVAGATRTNITVVEDDGTTTKLNAAGPPLSAAEVEDLLSATVAAVAEAASGGSAPAATWVVGCGSLPPGVPVDFYARLIDAVHRHTGARVAIDSSGAALRAALDAGPDLIKPNEHELAEVTGQEVTTLGQAVDAAQTLVDKGVEAVLLTLGRHGAIAVRRGAEVRHAEPRPTAVRSTVGAGDATLAGWLHHSVSGGSDGELLPTAVAWGTAAAALPGTTMPGPADLDPGGVTVHPRIDRNRRLDG